MARTIYVKSEACAECGAGRRAWEHRPTNSDAHEFRPLMVEVPAPPRKPITMTLTVRVMVDRDGLDAEYGIVHDSEEAREFIGTTITEAAKAAFAHISAVEVL